MLILKTGIKNGSHIVFNALFAKLYEKDNPERMRHYNKLNDTIINWGCMKSPCSRKDIDRFEEDNQGLISTNVYKQPNGKQHYR